MRGAGTPLRESAGAAAPQRAPSPAIPDHYVADCLKQAAEGRTETKTFELKDGRIIALVSRPMRGGGWVATHTDVTEQLLAEKERDSLRQREERRARRSMRRSPRSAPASKMCSTPSGRAPRR